MDGSAFPERLVTGFQPTPTLHLGHYVGAVSPCIVHQDLIPSACFVFIADLHALTRFSHPTPIYHFSSNVVRSLLALGIDPEKCMVYRQSDVTKVCELAWILSCLVGKGTLERAHAYKASLAEGRPPSVGLLLYPLLQAADIIAVRATRVPAGADQRQHIELARHVARRINALGQPPILPEPVLDDEKTTQLLGIDGIRKMSVHHRNIISIFEDEMIIANQINSIVSIDVRQGEPVDPDQLCAFQYLKIVTAESVWTTVGADLANGSITMADLKDLLLTEFLTFFQDARDRYQHLAGEPEYIRDVLGEGATQARREAAETVLIIRELVGY